MSPLHYDSRVRATAFQTSKKLHKTLHNSPTMPSLAGTIYIGELFARFKMFEYNGTQIPIETGHDLHVQTSLLDSESSFLSSIADTGTVIPKVASILGWASCALNSIYIPGCRIHCWYLNFKQNYTRSSNYPIRLAVAKRVLRHLKGTKALALAFGSKYVGSLLVRFSDSD